MKPCISPDRNLCSQSSVYRGKAWCGSCGECSVHTREVLGFPHWYICRHIPCMHLENTVGTRMRRPDRQRQGAFVRRVVGVGGGQQRKCGDTRRRRWDAGSVRLGSSREKSAIRVGEGCRLGLFVAEIVSWKLIYRESYRTECTQRHSRAHRQRCIRADRGCSTSSRPIFSMLPP